MTASPEQQNKLAGGGFGHFMAAKRAEFMQKCQGQPISAVTKLGGEIWKQLSESEKTPYNQAFKEAQKKYAIDMEGFLAAGGVKQNGAAALRSERKRAKEGKTKKQKDPNAPKRPVGGAYGCFVVAHREEFQKACPGAITGVAKMASENGKSFQTLRKVDMLVNMTRNLLNINMPESPTRLRLERRMKDQRRMKEQRRMKKQRPQPRRQRWQTHVQNPRLNLRIRLKARPRRRWFLKRQHRFLQP